MPCAVTVMPVTLDVVRDRLSQRPPVAVSGEGLIEAAVALILAPDRGGHLMIPFIKRAEREGDPWSGQMALPGGRRERVDASLEVTAKRETREETGIDLEGADRIGILDDLSPQSPHLPPIVVRPFVFGLTDQPRLVPSDEVADYVWVGFEGLRERRTMEEIDLRGHTIVTPAYRIGGEIVWGMTERILTPFLERFG